MSNDKVFQQDLNNQANPPGTVFIMHLLFDEKCVLPDKETMQSIMEKHLGEAYCFAYDEKMAGFAPGKYKTHFEKENTIHNHVLRDIRGMLYRLPAVHD